MRIDVAVTRKDGTLGLPSDIYRAGWWDGSSRLGDPYGAIVVAAHVDSLDAGLGPFANLLEVRSGHTVRLVGPSISQEFRVVSVTFQPRVSLSERPETLAPHGDQRLVLITCGGPFDADHGGYRDNVIVTAAPRGAPQPLRR